MTAESFLVTAAGRKDRVTICLTFKSGLVGIDLDERHPPAKRPRLRKILVRNYGEGIHADNLGFALLESMNAMASDIAAGRRTPRSMAAFGNAIATLFIENYPCDECRRLASLFLLGAVEEVTIHAEPVET